jgi:hypothetical protein
VRRPATALALAGVLAAGCGGGPSEEQQVRDTVVAFGRATAAKDYHRMCADLLAPKLVEQVQSIGLPCEVALQQGLGDVRDPRLIVGRITVAGESARAQIRTSAAGQAPSSDTLKLEKVKGKWRIASLGR